MKQFIKNTLVRILGSLISSLLVYAVLFYGFRYYTKLDKHVKIEPNTFLVLDLQGQVVENIHKNIITQLFEKDEKRTPETKILFWDILTKIHSSIIDKNILGIVLNIGYLDIGWAQIEELKKAIVKFKQSGKKVVAYCKNCSQKNYLLLTDVDYIVMHPDTAFFLHGISSSAYLFYKNALDKLDIDVNVFKAGEYKSAVEPYTSKKMSDKSRSQLTLVLKDIDTFFKAELMKVSAKDLPNINNIINLVKVDSPYEAFRYNFINKVGNYDFLMQYLHENLSNAKMNFCLDQFYEVKKEKHKKNAKKIMIIALEGVIIQGASSKGNIGSTTTCDIIEKIRTDSEVDAVIIRVNSPGGCAFASQLIFEAIERLGKAKPVVVSMSNLAASGGYYISSASKKIFANHTTITGSIGVYSVSFDIHKLINKLGLNTDIVKINDNADLLKDMGRKLTDFEKSKLQQSLLEVYDKFLSLVANSRKIGKEKLHEELASGRVWAGASAKNFGLVDEIASIDEVIDYLCLSLGTTRENSNVEFLYDPLSFIDSGIPIQIFSKVFIQNTFIENTICEKLETAKNLIFNLSNKNLFMMEQVINIE